MIHKQDLDRIIELFGRFESLAKESNAPSCLSAHAQAQRELLIMARKKQILEELGQWADLTSSIQNLLIALQYGTRHHNPENGTFKVWGTTYDRIYPNV